MSSFFSDKHLSFASSELRALCQLNDFYTSCPSDRRLLLLQLFLETLSFFFSLVLLGRHIALLPPHSHGDSENCPEACIMVISILTETTRNHIYIIGNSSPNDGAFRSICGHT